MKLFYTTLLGCFLSMAVIAQPAGWNYVQPLQVTNNTASLVTNYQLQLTVNTLTPIGAGQMLANGDDIRFGKDCAGTTLFNYWIESGINTATTTIWVKIDTLPASGTMQFYMFYGNASATPVSAVIGTFIGPHSSTDSVASGGSGGIGNSQRGFRFSPNETVLMTHVGKREPTGTTRTVTLFDFSTQAIVTQQTVGGPAAQYSYNALTTPVWLTQGTQYVLELYQGAGDGYYFGTSSQIGQHLTYYDMRYCNSCTQNTFPTNTLSNYQYGYPDMWYFTKQTLTVAPTVGPGVMGSGSLTTSTTGVTSVCVGDSATVTIAASGGTGNYSYTWTPAAGMANPNAASSTLLAGASGMYYCVVSDPCGNTNTDSIYVTVNSAPAVIATVSTDSVCMGGSFVPNGSGAVSYFWSSGLTDGVPFTPSVTDTYTVTGTDANGCMNSAVATVEVLSLPSVAANVSANSVCAGDSVVFAGSGATSYTWDNGVTDNVSYVPAGSMMYHVTGTDIYGCNNYDSVSVTANPLPVVVLTGPATACDLDAPFTLAGSPAGGTFSGPGVTGNTFDPSVAGSGTHILMYSYTDSLGCSSSDTSSVVVDLCLGLNNTVNSGVQVMPNPFSSMLSVNVDAQAYATIYNSLGQIVLQQDVNPGRNDINTSSLESGVYFLTVKTAAQTTTVRIVKSK